MITVGSNGTFKEAAKAHAYAQWSVGQWRAEAFRNCAAWALGVKRWYLAGPWTTQNVASPVSEEFCC